MKRFLLNLYLYAERVDLSVPITINGTATAYEIENGYAILNRIWKRGDVVEVNLSMNVRRVKANEKLKDDIGKVALQRGPLMYCAEWPDNNGAVSNIILPSNAKFTTAFEPALLNGVMVLKSNVNKIEIKDNKVSTSTQPLVAIPYYAWANRGKGEMMLWFPEQVKSVDIISQ